MRGECTALTITPASAHQLRSEALPMAAAVDLLPSAAESREGYQRTSFKHWVDADGSGRRRGTISFRLSACRTRRIVKIADAVRWSS
ncbi:hypothetical protein ACUXZZ_00230 [Streptomyces graminifolii]|uniref:hypothetical protein n=1 Tax=Streptomyces graminifolii TaxID=1266771 RepID=UPI004057DF4A